MGVGELQHSGEADPGEHCGGTLLTRYPGVQTPTWKPFGRKKRSSLPASTLTVPPTPNCHHPNRTPNAEPTSHSRTKGDGRLSKAEFFVQYGIIYVEVKEEKKSFKDLMRERRIAAKKPKAMAVLSKAETSTLPLTERQPSILP